MALALTDVDISTAAPEPFKLLAGSNLETITIPAGKMLVGYYSSTNGSGGNISSFAHTSGTGPLKIILPEGEYTAQYVVVYGYITDVNLSLY